MIIFSDLQLNRFNPVMGVECLKTGLNSLRQVRDYALANDEKYIVFLGDFFQLKDKIPTVVWNEAFDEIHSWGEMGLISFWLKGNHDFHTDDSLKSFQLFDRAQPILSPGVFDIEGNRVGFVPYGSLFKELPSQKYDIVFLHDSFTDFCYDRDFGGVNSLREILDSSSFLFAGHYHGFTEMVKGCAWHIGSTYQTTFSEAGQKKYFAVFKENKVSFVPFDFPELIELRNTLDGDVKGKFVKCKMEIKGLSDLDVKAVKRDLMGRGALGVKIEYTYAPIIKKRTEDAAVENFSDEDYADVYVREAYKKDGRAELASYLGKQIIEECRGL